MKNILLLVIFLVSISQDILAKNNIIFYNSNIGMGSNIIDIGVYTNTQEEQDMYKNNMSIDVNKMLVNEFLGSRYINLLDKKYFSQILPIKRFAIVPQEDDSIAVLKNNNAKEFYKTIGSYDDLKDNVLAYINENVSSYTRLTRNVSASTNANIYFMSFYIPAIKGRVDTYEKVDASRNNIYSIETSLNTRINTIIYKYYPSTQRFRFYKEIQAPPIRVSKTQDNDSFVLNRVIKASDIKSAVGVKMNKMLDDAISYVDKKLSKDSDFSRNNEVVDIDKKSLFNSSPVQLEENIQKNSNNDDMFVKLPKVKKEKVKEKIEPIKEIPMKDIVADSAIIDVSNQNNISIFLDVNNASLINHTKKVTSLAYSLGLGYEMIIGGVFYWDTSITYGFSNFGNKLPKLDTIFEATVFNETYKPVSNSSSYSGSLGVGVRFINTNNFSFSFGTNINIDVLNMQYKDFSSIYSPKVIYMFIEPILSMRYNILKNFNVSLSAGYSIPLYNISFDMRTKYTDTIKDKTQSMVNNFLRESEPNVYVGLSYSF